MYGRLRAVFHSGINRCKRALQIVVRLFDEGMILSAYNCLANTSVRRAVSVFNWLWGSMHNFVQTLRLQLLQYHFECQRLQYSHKL